MVIFAILPQAVPALMGTQDAIVTFACQSRRALGQTLHQVVIPCQVVPLQALSSVLSLHLSRLSLSL